MATKMNFQLAITLLITIISLAVLSVAIATLVKVYKKDDEDSTDRYKPQQIQSSDPKYQGFSDAVERLKLLMDLKADPCDDFYQFTCGQYNGSVSFTIRQKADYDTMLTLLEDPTKKDYSNLQPVNQMLLYYKKCKETDPSPYYNDVAYVQKILDGFKSETGIVFPALDDTEWTYEKIAFSKAIGYLYGRLNIPTFITPWVDTDWPNPDTGFKLFFGQPTLYYGSNYYLKAWDQVETTYRNTIVHILKVLRTNAGKPINSDTINADIDNILSMEMTIAKSYTATEAENRLYLRQYNEYNETSASESFQFIDWSSLLSQTSYYAEDSVKDLLHNSSFIIQEKEVLTGLGQVISALKAPFDARTIANYFYVRIALTYAQYMQNAKEVPVWNYAVSLPSIGNRKDVWRRPKPVRKVGDDRRYVCAEATMYNLQYSNARVFLDAAYPKEEDRVNLRKNVAKVTNSILVAFRGMLGGLKWMDEDTRQGANEKITYLVKNMAYPDFITNDVQLTEYYSKMEAFADTDTLLAMNDKIFRWSMWKVFSRLAQASYERDYFDLPPGLVNAWYQPELNSLTLPLAILGQPFYDINWPSSLNYGSLGVIAGHELSHGFDDEGVQWDGKGFLSQWMTNNSYESFKEMAQCVIDEYSNFKPPGMPNLSGEQTQGENIADNGGIHAAFRAYKDDANLNGEEPRLNDPVFSEFTHDQLFFIGFAQVWCESADTKYGTLDHDLTNPHSPSIFRVLGTIQNFPAFKNAFNCPLNKAYTPAKHCNVWVSDISEGKLIMECQNNQIKDLYQVPKRERNCRCYPRLYKKPEYPNSGFANCQLPYLKTLKAALAADLSN